MQDIVVWLAHIISEIISQLFLIAFYGALPAVLVWAWVRFSTRPRVRGVLPVLSVTGLAFATASTILALVTALHFYTSGGASLYEPGPVQIYIYRIAVLLSLSAPLLAIGGMWRANPVRWHSLGASLVVLFFWFAVAMGR